MSVGNDNRVLPRRYFASSNASISASKKLNSARSRKNTRKNGGNSIGNSPNVYRGNPFCFKIKSYNFAA
jgi:hypothetical protein